MCKSVGFSRAAPAAAPRAARRRGAARKAALAARHSIANVAHCVWHVPLRRLRGCIGVTTLTPGSGRAARRVRLLGMRAVKGANHAATSEDIGAAGEAYF
jgi:hypothetical protein